MQLRKRGVGGMTIRKHKIRTKYGKGLEKEDEEMFYRKIKGENKKIEKVPKIKK